MAESYKPTAAMAAQARAALKMRDSQPPSNKGMTRVGLARANQLIRLNRLRIYPTLPLSAYILTYLEQQLRNQVLVGRKETARRSRLSKAGEVIQA